MTSWTTEQQDAIDTRDTSLLVAAAAGSGKTAVLVERIIQMISDTEHPVNVDELLVVTFTNAAAQEMKERIGDAIAKALEANPSSEHLHRQSLLLQKAKITTLHSFCLELVRENFFHLGLDPGMKIADDTENNMILEDTVAEIMEEYYSMEDNDLFLNTVNAYGGREDADLIGMLLSLYHMAQSMAEPKRWLESLTGETNIDWFQLAEEDILDRLESVQKHLITAIRYSDGEPGLEKYFLHIGGEYDWVTGLMDTLKHDGWDALYKAIAEDGFKRLPAAKKNTYDPEAKDRITGLRDQAKKELSEIREDYFLTPREAQEADLRDQESIRNLLVELVLKTMDRFQEKKSKRSLMDFSDMEHFCFNLLYRRDPALGLYKTDLARMLSDNFYEVMVDEYQDINDLQEAILLAVSREDNLFMVGDIKQSIYGFRMANPNLFLEKYNRFGQNIPMVHEKRIDLNQNFRCRENVVNGVNEVFEKLMTGEDGDLFYDDKAALVYGANYPDVIEESEAIPEVVNCYVLTPPGECAAEDGEGKLPEGTLPGDEGEQPMGTMEEEGLFLANEMHRLMESGAQVYDKHLKTYRKITWRDMVVLLRSPGSSGPVYARMLKDCGIPASVDVGDGYFTAWEIRIILAVLYILDNPLQDIPLIAVLKAPFFAFTEDELAEIRLVKPGADYYESLCDAVESEAVGEELKEKIRDFLTSFLHWRVLARQLSLSDLIWKLYKETGFYEYVGALRDGLQRQANLRALHERAAGFEETSFKGVFLFLCFLQMLQDNRKDLEPARVLSDNENVVRILSIHKSKGLEFPVVFLGGMGKQFNKKDIQRPFLLDKEYGMAFPYTDQELMIRYPTIACRVIQKKKYKELIQEEKRILYVAMTRARERLYLVGSMKKPEHAENLSVKNAKSYLEWILSMKLSEPLWHIEFVEAGSFDKLDGGEELTEPLRDAVLSESPLERDDKTYEAMEEQLNWQYPEPDFIPIKAHFSVSELKRRITQKDSPVMPKVSFDHKPDCLTEGKKLSAAEKGTLLHLVLSKVDLSREITLDSLKNLVDELEAKAFIPEGVKDEIDLSLILGFYESDLGKRLIQAKPDCRYRELPFMVELDSHVVDETLPEGKKKILVQGIIDCLWQEEDGSWVLVDYKSDRVKLNETKKIHDRYDGQLALYRYAVEQILHGEVKESYFYLLTSKLTVPVTFGEDSIEK